MAGVVLLARETGRAGRAAAALGWAAVLLLLSDPRLIGDAGFQLSSLATAGLIAWATPLTEWIEATGRGRLPHWLAESLGVSLAAQAATLPIVLVSFGRLALVAPVVNLAVVPLVAPAMAVGLVAMVGGGLVVAGAPAVVGAVLAAPGWVILRLLDAIVVGRGGRPVREPQPHAPWDTARGGPFDGRAARAGLVAARTGQPNRPPDTDAASPAVAARRPRCAGRSHPPAGSPNGPRPLALVIAVAVVGGRGRRTSGDVRSGDHPRCRPGRRNPGRRIPRRAPADRRRPRSRPTAGRRSTRCSRPGIDGSTPSSSPTRTRTTSPAWRCCWTATASAPCSSRGCAVPDPGYAAWVARLARAGAPVRGGIAAGDRLQVDEIALRVLWPIRGQVPLEPPDGGTGINNVSVVLLGQVGSRRFLLMGDVEQAIDPRAAGRRACRASTCSRSPITAARPPRPSRSSTWSALVSRSRLGRGRQSVRSSGRRPRWTGSRRPARVSCGPTAMGPWSSASSPAAMTVRAEGGRVTASPSRRATSSAAVAATAFRCAIPVTALIPEREPAPVARRGPGRDRPGARGAPLSSTIEPMTVPGRVEAASLLLSLDPPAWFVRHARAVAEVAAWLAARIEARGVAVDRRLVEAAALLHDVDKALPAGDPARALPHGDGSAAWLTRAGARRAGAGRRRPPGHAAPGRRGLPTLGGVRVARGADRRLCRQARRPAARLDGRSLRVVAATLRRAGVQRTDAAPGPAGVVGRQGPSRPARGRRLRSRGRDPFGDQAAGVDR